MQAIIRLLSLQDSSVTEAVRHGLHGLSSQLRATLERAPQDPGANDGIQLLDELSGLLGEKAWQTKAESPPRQGGLARLRQELEGRPALRERLGRVRFDSVCDADLWGEAQRLFLRLNPEDHRLQTQVAADVAQQAGAARQTHDPLVLRDDMDEDVYPGLEGDINSQGLRLSATGPLHPALGDEPSGPDASNLAGAVSFYLRYIELDRSLHHALEGIRPLGIHQLVGRHLDAYGRELVSRFRRVITATNPMQSLRAWISLDEAIHALVHLPIAGQNSWWRQHQQRSRQRLDKAASLARRAGHRVHLRWLTGTYKQVRDHSTNDWGLETGGNPGEVLLCLRVYAEIDGRAFPGRVIYRDY